MKHIPNILSACRIALLPFFVWQMTEGHSVAAAVLLLVSGVTDFADGFLARRFGWISNTGKVLDPAADKLTQVTVCVVLAMRMPRLWVFFALLLFKEGVMLCLGAWLMRKRIHIEGSRWFGKVVTAMFYAAAFALIAFPSIPGAARIAILSAVTLCAFGAGALYIPQFRKYHSQAVSCRGDGLRA